MNRSTQMSFALFAFSAWISVALHAESVDQLTVTQWVRTSPLGQLRVNVVLPKTGARSVPMKGASVRLVGQNGIEKVARADDAGLVEFSDLKAGIYALSATSKGAFACYSIHVLDPVSDAAGQYPDFAVIACASESDELFAKAVASYLPGEYGLDQLKLDQRHAKQLVPRTRGNEQFRIQQVDGGMNGVIYQSSGNGVALDDQDRADQLDPAEQTSVFLYQQGRRIRHELTNRSGRFEFRNIEPGVYSLMAVGRDGVGSVGFELAAESFSANFSSPDGTHLIQKINAACPSFAMQVVPCLQPIQVVMPDACCEPTQAPVAEVRSITEPGIPVDPTVPGTPLPRPTPGVGGIGGGGLGGGGGGGAELGVGSTGIAGPLAVGALFPAITSLSTSADDGQPFIPPAAASQSMVEH